MSDQFDAIIIGGGPGGATAGLVMARQGLNVCILEKDSHPRFHIGESILPRVTPLIEELGLSGAMQSVPHVPKLGAEFGFGNDFSFMQFGFSDGLLPGQPVFNIERAPFDAMLFSQAVAAGAHGFENEGVRSIDTLTQNDVAVTTTTGRSLKAKVLIDASGQSTVVGRHLKQRRAFTEPQLQKVAYFQHFEGVERNDGDSAGHPTIVMADEGWFWMISINEKVMSIGFVTRPQFVKKLNIAPEKMLAWAIARCPVVRHRMRDADGPSSNQVAADFSYTCRPHAGPGYFLVGDAGNFLDPIFSAGVTLAMVSGAEAGKIVAQLLRGELLAGSAQSRYRNFVVGSTQPFWKLIRSFYKHEFRELFMNGTGPAEVHKAVISTLAGQVFPKPKWALRWRLWLFHLCVFGQRYVTLVPRRPHFSLLAEAPVERAEPALAAV